MKSCAIVILNYNGEEMLNTFLPSVCMYSSYDVWVIDNSSTDGSLNFLEKNYPQIQQIKLEENFGYAGGYNKGLAEIEDHYEYFILLNSDVEVTAGWDVNLIAWINAHPDYAALQPKILSWKEKDTFDYAGAGGGFLDAYGYPYCRGRIWDSVEIDKGNYNDAIDVDWASGACMVVKSTLFHQLSGFDSDFFAHMEEIDLCWRMRKSGWKIGYQGSVEVYHLGGATLDRASPKKMYLNIRNSLSMLYKNETSSRFFWIFLVKSLLEHLAAMSFISQGKKEFSKAVLDAYRDFRTKKSTIEKFQPKVDGREEVKRKGKINLIFWYWKVLGKKSYDQL
ncbi:glycosyltransferase family 2 protein [Algoriphagus sp. D3-2-R+10]|uniref:glycosyltransferase family 2 protein n=1 Tax=Algoriphagus aurantiacus TaxID=3103948 RepID=UPI002B391028|nr:glycosyltransferase family 2 protein [Algoriphagus sp. D3-2-R+10]MEB2774501.1 glycosyltransferase family 2 protein [Algoriphagus sp. D3-2-R+10]